MFRMNEKLLEPSNQSAFILTPDMVNCLVQSVCEDTLKACTEMLAHLENGIPPAEGKLPYSEGEADMARKKIKVEANGTTKWFTGETEKEAYERAIHYLAAAQGTSTKPVAPETPLLRDYLAQFQADFKSTLRPATKEAYARSIKNHILPALGDMHLNEIDTVSIQRLYNNMAESGLARETIPKVKNILSPCLDSAVEDGFIPRNPMRSKRLNIPTNKGTHHKALPEKMMVELRLALPTMKDDDLRRMLALLTYSGLRIGEILGLRWEDIDTDKRRIHVVRGVVHPDRNQSIVGEPKTKASARCIPLQDALAEVLKPMQEHGYILGGDAPLTYQQQKRRWQRLKALFQLEEYALHDFRGTCLTEWYESGMKMEAVSAFAGHTNTATTAKYYVKVREKTVDESAEIMNRMYPMASACGT